MAIRVALNGFGRIGRNVLQHAHSTMTTFSSFTSMTSRMTPHWPTCSPTTPFMVAFGEVQTVRGGLQINGRITTSAERDLQPVAVGETDVDIVMECTGVFRDRAGASKHLSAGAKRVIISAPAGDPDTTICIGVNDETKALRTGSFPTHPARQKATSPRPRRY